MNNNIGTILFMSCQSLPKPLRLWFYSRFTGLVLSGSVPLTSDNQRDIFITTGIKITQDDINKFPKILSTYKLYSGILYRGVFTTDNVYQELMKTGTALTTRYYSCTSEKYVGKLFGNKILLVISGSSNFDVRHVSREKEIILDKNILLKLESSSIEDEYTILFISCINP